MDFEGRVELEKPIGIGAPSGAFQDNQITIAPESGPAATPALESMPLSVI